jgi:hypothetical protein
MNQTLSLVPPVPIGYFPLQVQLVQRLVLYHGELYRVPVRYCLLRITAGRAYVTQAGQDYSLRRGQELGLDSTADVALVSAIGGEAVILELFDTSNGPSQPIQSR